MNDGETDFSKYSHEQIARSLGKIDREWRIESLGDVHAHGDAVVLRVCTREDARP